MLSEKWRPFFSRPQWVKTTVPLLMRIMLNVQPQIQFSTLLYFGENDKWWVFYSVFRFISYFLLVWMFKKLQIILLFMLSWLRIRFFPIDLHWGLENFMVAFLCLVCRNGKEIDQVSLFYFLLSSSCCFLSLLDISLIHFMWHSSELWPTRSNSQGNWFSLPHIGLELQQFWHHIFCQCNPRVPYICWSSVAMILTQGKSFTDMD